MPNRGGRNRTGSESRAFKAKIINLRAQQKSIVKIAKQMGVSRQYVSLVLNEAGLGGRIRMPKEKRSGIKDKTRPKDDDIDTDISRLERRGNYSLAYMLRAVAKRRTEKRPRIKDKTRPNNDEVDQNIFRLEQRGEYSLANLLQAVVQRRKR
jgi:transposase-like protein